MTQEPQLSKKVKETLTRVAEKIRRNEVILWTGAGFNCDAGLPTGAKLVEIIREKCTPNECERLDAFGTLLPDVTEEFVRMRANSRRELIDIIRETFSIESKDKTVHQFITDIPQFKHIVTTNYDRLVEDEYGDMISVAFDDGSFARIPIHPRVAYYKIHGDLKNNEIVITRSDYTKFLREEWETILWAKVKSLIASNSVLFVGYGHNDQNVKQLFGDIIKQIGPLQPEGFFVSPDIPDYLISDLSTHRITPIQATAHQAIEFLRNEILTHLAVDTKAGFVSPVVAVPLLKKHFDISTKWETDEDGNPLLKQFGPSSADSLELKMTMGMDIGQKLMDYHSGKHYEPVTIFSENLKEFSISAKGVVLPVGIPDSITISKDTKYTGEIIGGEPTINLTCSLTVRPTGDTIDLIVETEFFTAKFESINPKEAKQIKANLTLRRVHDAVKGGVAARLLQWWIQGGQPSFVSDDKSIFVPLPFVGELTSDGEDFGKTIDGYIVLCDDIVSVIRKYGVYLEVPEDTDDKDWEMLDYVLDALRGRKRLVDELKIHPTLENSKSFKSLLDEPQPISLTGGKDHVVNLFGKEINLGRVTVTTLDAVIANEEEFLKAIDDESENVAVEIKSKSNQLYFSFVNKQS